jgi:signal transduction histidine kinase/CheY-like chemotaxis protein
MSSSIHAGALRRNHQAGLVQEQFVLLFLQQNKRAQSGILVSAVLIFFLLAYRIEAPWAYAWIALVAVVSGVRFGLTDRLVRTSPRPVRVISLLLLVNGICLALPILAFGHFTDVHRAFVSVVLIALATASVATTSGYRSVFLWFAAAMLLPLGSAWMAVADSVESPWVGVGLGSLIVFYLLFLAGLARDAFRVFDESCRIRFTEQKLNGQLAAALETAQQASQAKTRFLAAASHDLRQPLHTIGVLVAAIGLRKLDDRSREIVQMLDNVSHSLSGQLDGLLDVSKLDAGIVMPELQIESLDQLLRSHVTAMEPHARERGLYIKLHCEEPMRVMTDPSLLGRILGNLTGNALKFTTIGGVDVFLKRHGHHAVIDVVDSGIGIAPELQKLVFQEFYQIGNDERDRSKGLGLGLAIVQRMCALLDIELTLDSRPGVGSRFSLRLPLTADFSDPQMPVELMEAVDVSSLHVLVIDDEMDVRESMRLLLEELGCLVLLADGVSQAVQQAETGRIDMVISDFRLKGSATGVDTVKQIQQIHPRIYPLLISGDTAPDRLQQAQAAEIALLHKPVTLDELIEHLHSAKSAHGTAF